MVMTINGSGSITGLSAGGLPDATVTQADLAPNVAGTGPAFRAYASTTTSLISNTGTKVTFDSETFDSAACYDAASSRFQPAVPGYYNISARVGVATTNTTIVVMIYKNGVQISQGPYSQSMFAGSVNDCIYLAAGDYVEILVSQGAATQNNVAGSQASYFSGFLARAA